MIETNLPRWTARLDATRTSGFSDLLPIVAAHYRAHEAAEKFLGPYNARQRNSSMPYSPPDKNVFKSSISQGRMNDFSYQSYLNSLIRFCETSKGMRGLPEPHPSTVHSIQLPQPSFELSTMPNGDTMVSIIGVDSPLVVKGLRNAKDIKFIIVRPKLSKLGTASGLNWEVLFFKDAYGYIPDWADSSINTRWAGKIN